MAYRLFKDENLAQYGHSGGGVLAGITDQDDGRLIEQGITLPWVIDPQFSWLAYDLTLEVMLDSGIVLHKVLPQVAQPIDTLASAYIDDFTMDKSKKGTNFISKGKFSDFVQRMATSDYKFVLRGFGMRAGYQIPVPGLKKVCGVTAYPDEIQWSSGNKLVGNYSGVPVWFCQWRLEYFIIAPPTKDQIPPFNPALHIRGDAQLPDQMQAPYSQADQNSQASVPTQR